MPVSLDKIVTRATVKTFLAVNFGCRVNAAETNLICQRLVDTGFQPNPSLQSPGVILVNTCSVTKKANIESLGKIRQLHKQFPSSRIIITGCAKTDNIKNLKNVHFLNNRQKDLLTRRQKSAYTPKINDKFSHTNRYLLKIQSGCNFFCSYCIVPYRRPSLWSLPIKTAINATNLAVKNNYREIIITGTNLELYRPGLANLIRQLLQKTSIPLISFGSIPLNCLNDDLIDLFSNPKYQPRLDRFLHIPLQSGSTKILKLMNRRYHRQKIIKVFSKLKASNSRLQFGTDIIVGFPGETETDFKSTLNLCRQIGFRKIHVFPFSPRPGTAASRQKYPYLNKQIIKSRSKKLRFLVL